jgi:hypothetical protein
MWRTAKSGIDLTGDVAYGGASTSDPNFANRVGDMASTALMLPSLASGGGENVLNEGLRRSTAAPAIVAASNPTSDQVAAVMSRAADLRRGAWPQAPTSLFETSPEAYARTTDVVPQTSVRSSIPAPSEAYPLSSPRTAQISGASSDIASAIADRLYPWAQTQDPRLMFYNTGPIYEKLAQQGIDPTPIMRGWSGQVAATSPRTQTPTNLRNASYLLYRQGTGNPFTQAEFEAAGNPPGYAFMGSQVGSGERFAAGTQSLNSAPKQSIFRPNVQGNLADPTIDTHNIRGSIYQFDQLNPGQLHPDWFTSPEAYAAYRANGGFTPNALIGAGDIDDSLANVTRGGVKKQIEYGPMTDPIYGAANQLGISPAQAQAGGWFSYGNVTGLRSPVRSLTQLLNDQLYDTARTISVPPERVLDWWARKLIPLTQNEPPAGPRQTQIG